MTQYPTIPNSGLVGNGSVTIRKRSHHFLVTNPSKEVRLALREMIEPLIQWDFRRVRGRIVKSIQAVFAVSNASRTEYRLHISLLPKFLKLLANYGYVEEDIRIYEDRPGRGAKVKYEFHDHIEPKEHQLDPIAYLADASEPRIRLLGLQTGQGKTASTKFALGQARRRSAIFMPAGYLGNWEESCEKLYKEGGTENLFIVGSAKLRKVIRDAKAGKKITFASIYISSDTFSAWLKMYERDQKRFRREYQIQSPDQIWKLLAIDTVVIDEGHEYLHFNYKLFMYLNIWRSITLSATYESGNKFITEIQEMMHPTLTRFETGELKRYSEASMWLYEFSNPDKIRTTEHGDERYSHNAFERFFLKHPRNRENYYEMIYQVVKVDYFEIKNPGESLLIFMSTVENCEALAKYIAKRHPDLRVTHFVAGGNYTEEFLKADVVVSTIGKTGTAVDKPGLRTVIMTVSLGSIVGFKQAFGRLREIPGVVTRFSMIAASNIDRQYANYQDKVRLMPLLAIRTLFRKYPKQM